LLKIKNLSVKIAGNLVLNNLNLEVNSGSFEILMGPNGSGKSSLAATLMGHPDYEIITGEIYLADQNITKLSTHERAKLGLFLAFQHPKAIAGLPVFSFLKTIYEAYTGNTIPVPEFENLLNKKLDLVGLDKSFVHREVNVGFSGGEKKRLEILQFLLLQPRLAMIDEIDSGLDVDALKLVANAINIAKQNNPRLTIILITHYNRIVDFLCPDNVHIMQQGKLVKSGDLLLVKQIETAGYEDLA
jgi:Fe-S cluster assembly ATP-binding protein